MENQQTVSDAEYYKTIKESLPKELDDTLKRLIAAQPIINKYTDPYNILIVTEPNSVKKIVDSVLSNTDDTTFIQTLSNQKTQQESKERQNQIIQYLDLNTSANHSTYNQIYEVTQKPTVGALPDEDPLLTFITPENDEFDEYEPIKQQIPLKPSIIKEYDFIYVLQHTTDLLSGDIDSENIVLTKDESSTVQTEDELRDKAKEVLDEFTLYDTPYDISSIIKLIQIQNLKLEEFSPEDDLESVMKTCGYDPKYNYTTGPEEGKKIKRTIKEICEEKEDNSSDTQTIIAKEEEIIEKCEEKYGFTEETVNQKLEKLARKGEIYYPGSLDGLQVV